MDIRVLFFAVGAGLVIGVFAGTDIGRNQAIQNYSYVCGDKEFLYGELY